MGYKWNFLHCNTSEKKNIFTLLDCFRKQTAWNLGMEAGREDAKENMREWVNEPSHSELMLHNNKMNQ